MLGLIVGVRERVGDDGIAELGRVEGTAGISVGALLGYKVGTIEGKSDGTNVGINVKLGLYEGDVGTNVRRVGSLLDGNRDCFEVGILVIGKRAGDAELGLHEGREPEGEKLGVFEGESVEIVGTDDGEILVRLLGETVGIFEVTAAAASARRAFMHKISMANFGIP
jgi:hypothetical protein